jgi:hypothetical protein
MCGVSDKDVCACAWLGHLELVREADGVAHAHLRTITQQVTLASPCKVRCTYAQRVSYMEDVPEGHLP